MKYTTLEEVRKANAKRSLDWYNSKKDDEEYKAKRREKAKARYYKNKARK